ncbi:DNA-binding transcriptional LysR family regulator [Kribbella aluminosa]|uniref:DNA-binding transcriptional LysR family regulator n=1 Tax=Kribbella aluminosa TaxID=416017 RepID=A0ABS4UWK1_9ACTN|nr:LysR family transcriptional regulator [Kribbella aluminosa]MBP2356037.1 DNA-binding transcriptional LysR family regulator [Kribbella aluminosa]
MAVTLQRLEVFCAVARSLSFSSAARELYTSQPHVSNQIRRLEEHYKVELFVRARQGIRLTDAGLALFEQVDRILSDLQDAEQVLVDFRSARRGVVRLAATTSIGSHVLPGIVAGFRREHPGISVSLLIGNTEQVQSMIDDGQVDVAVTPLSAGVRPLGGEPFRSYDLVVVARAGTDLPDPIPVAELAAQPLVARENGSRTLELMRDLLAGHPTTVVAQLTGPVAVIEAVCAGAGVSVVSSSAAQMWAAAGLVSILRIADRTPMHHYHLVYPPRRTFPAAARELITYLRGHTPPAVACPDGSVSPSYRRMPDPR